ncbi:MAG: hypothetical protein QNJ98_00960 [Planctomycetota bacterium]|nr:hypothetical protein [Planctomycetota bacterium]
MLNKTWGSVEQLPAGESEAAKDGTSKARLLPKPVLIYVTDGTESSPFDKIEKVVLIDEKVSIGMWAFETVKMAPDKVRKDKILSAQWEEDQDRGFIFVSRDTKTIEVIDMKRMSTKTVFETMTTFANAAYKSDFETTLKDVLKVLTEFDKINNKRRRLTNKEATLTAENDKEALEDVALERQALDALETEMNAKRDKLLKFELKETKA